MTGYELRNYVTALGFNSELPDEDGFFKAANLAVMRMRTLIPVDSEIVPVSLDTLGEQIPIDEALNEAAVLLTAYYVWLEEDAAKASAYRGEYDYAVSQIMHRRKVEHTEIIKNNW